MLVKLVNLTNYEYCYFLNENNNRVHYIQHCVGVKTNVFTV